MTLNRLCDIVKAMENYGIKVAPIWTPMEPKEIRPLIEAYNCFTDKKISGHNFVSARYIGLPGAVLQFYSDKYKKTGRELIKKMGQMLSVTPIKSSFTGLITQKMGPLVILTDGIFSSLRLAGGDPVAAFRFGLVFQGMEEEEVFEHMNKGINWLTQPVGIHIKVIK